MNVYEVFENRFYGDYLCSGSGAVLDGICYCVGHEEGLAWRSFTPEFWKENIEGKLTAEEVYRKYPAAKIAE